MQQIMRRPESGETPAVCRMWEESFPECGPRFVDWYFSRVYDSARTLCLFEGGELVSSLQTIPYTLSVRGAPVGVETLSGVATSLSHRNRGHARKLMAEALRGMAARGVGFNFLYPFSHAFYQRLGWQACSASLEYAAPHASLPETAPEGWETRRGSAEDLPHLMAVYDGFMAGRNCRCLRDGRQWTRRIEETWANGGFLLLACHHGRPQAYALCEERADEVELTELAYARVQAMPALLSHLRPLGRDVFWTAPADDRAYLALGDWKGRVRLQPHVMFRVTDVGLAVSQAKPCRGGELVLEIKGDTMAPENNGIYRLSAEDGKARAARTDETPLFCCDVGAFARMLTGFADATEAMGAGQAAGTDEAARLLAAMYPRQNNFLFELY